MNIIILKYIKYSYDVKNCVEIHCRTIIKLRKTYRVIPVMLVKYLVGKMNTIYMLVMLEKSKVLQCVRCPTDDLQKCFVTGKKYTYVNLWVWTLVK